MVQPGIGAEIVIACDVMLEQPKLSATVSVTRYVPGAAYACVVFCVPDVAASPKFHDHVTTFAPEPSIVMGWPTQPVGGMLIVAVGTPPTFTICVSETEHKLLVTVRITMCGPDGNVTGGGFTPTKLPGVPKAKLQLHEVIELGGRNVE